MAADALRSVTCSNASLIALPSSFPFPFHSSRHSATLHQIFLSPQTYSLHFLPRRSPPARLRTLFPVSSSLLSWNGRDVIWAKGTHGQPASSLSGIRILFMPHPSSFFHADVRWKKYCNTRDVAQYQYSWEYKKRKCYSFTNTFSSQVKARNINKHFIKFRQYK